MQCIVNFFGYFENELKDDPRSLEYIQISKKIVDELKGTSDNNIYSILFQEARSRGLKLEEPASRELIFSDAFKEWQEYMKSNPTYIREIEATDFLGDYDISCVDDEVMGFDYPVREACKILNKKGYKTYWSSANREDYRSRKGQVIKNKTVAYILINHQLLTPDLKQKLLLDGECNFWGIAREQNDEGKFYGIWSEITSNDMLCIDISNNLSMKALELPAIEKLEDRKQEYDGECK